VNRGNVRWAIVGTESLVSGKISESALIGHLLDVRSRLDVMGQTDVPVATAEPYGSWANAQSGGLFRRNGSGELVHAEVLRNLDTLFVHIYPFHEGIAIDEAKQKLANMYSEVIAAVEEVKPGLSVIIGETGWPSESATGYVNGQAVASLENAERYFREVTSWSRDEDIPVFWFSSRDENWKTDGYAGVEKHWGLQYANGEPKFNIPEPTTTALLLLGLGGAVFRQRTSWLKRP
jgi:exo-beta-1,3-glucanase (GH17 family)